MRFDSIDIENYRQYKSLHITFPEKSGNDLHVIVASNGVGKTNLLDAINWCLYGDEPHLGDEDDALTIRVLLGKLQCSRKRTFGTCVYHCASQGFWA